MITFLLILIGLFLLGRLIIASAPHLLMWQMKRAANNFAQSQQRSRGTADARRRQQHRAAKRKIITRDMGEYVEFEELPPDPSAGKAAEVQYTKESQVEDAVWEDVK